MTNNASEQSPGVRGKAADSAKTTYSDFMAAIGYTIDGVGLVRAQYISKPELPGFDTGLLLNSARFRPQFNQFNRFEAAFAYTAERNMLLDIGFKYALSVSESFTHPGIGVLSEVIYKPGFGFGFGYKISWMNFDFNLLGTGHFGDGYIVTAGSNNTTVNEYAHGMNLNFHLTTDYDTSFGKLGLSLGIDITGKDKKDGNEVEGTGQTNFGAGFYARKDFSHTGSIYAGLNYTHLGVMGGGTRPPNSVSGYFRIPIYVIVNFL